MRPATLTRGDHQIQFVVKIVILQSNPYTTQEGWVKAKEFVANLQRVAIKNLHNGPATRSCANHDFLGIVAPKVARG